MDGHANARRLVCLSYLLRLDDGSCTKMRMSSDCPFLIDLWQVFLCQLGAACDHDHPLVLALPRKMTLFAIQHSHPTTQLSAERCLHGRIEKEREIKPVIVFFRVSEASKMHPHYAIQSSFLLVYFAGQITRAPVMRSRPPQHHVRVAGLPETRVSP